MANFGAVSEIHRIVMALQGALLEIKRTIHSSSSSSSSSSNSKNNNKNSKSNDSSFLRRLVSSSKLRDARQAVNKDSTFILNIEVCVTSRMPLTTMRLLIVAVVLIFGVLLV